MFVFGAAAAAGLCVAILLILLVLGARPRELTLARLSTMGLSPGQTRRLVFTEALPPVAAAITAGAVSALALIPLIGGTIDLSVFTGTAAPVTIRLDLVTVAYVAGGLLAIVLATLLGQTALARARGVTRALRVGE